MPRSGGSLEKRGQAGSPPAAAEGSPRGRSSVAVYEAKPPPPAERPPEQKASLRLLKTGLQM